jgi:hypothetical protein|tara:strand:+ start:51 stop:191 length:141 start_codon:yes stop_codon:yes gene_type:complete
MTIQEQIDKAEHQKQQLAFQEKTVKDQAKAIEEQNERIARLLDESN